MSDEDFKILIIMAETEKHFKKCYQRAFNRLSLFARMFSFDALNRCEGIAYRISRKHRRKHLAKYSV